MLFLGSFVQIILIIIALAIILMKDNLKIIILLSSFSLLSASLYFLNKAPDVALAEVAIGSAIMPLLYILSISKQREFIVISHVEDAYLSSTGKGFQLLKQFTEFYKLKLYILPNQEDTELKGIFRKSNVDLIIEKDDKSDLYFLIGKESSTLMNKLQQMVKDDQHTMVIKVKESETRD